jgi:hypothetical protein
MTAIVEVEVSDVCSLDCVLPRLTDTRRFLAGSVRKDKHGINTAYPCVLLHKRQSLTSQRHCLHLIR